MVIYRPLKSSSLEHSLYFIPQDSTLDNNHYLNFVKNARYVAFYI